MFWTDLANRGDGDVGLGRRSMVPKHSNSTSNKAGGSKSSQPDVIDLVSENDDNGEDAEDNDDDEDDDEVLEVNSPPKNDCVLVDQPQTKGRDINDNTGFGSGCVEKRPSLFERRSYQSSRHIPSVPSEMSGPGASFSRLSIYRRKSIQMSPDRRPICLPVTQSSATSCNSRTSVSGIILNRAYNKTPSTHTTTTSDRPDIELMQPVICLENIRDRLSISDREFSIPWHNRDASFRARSSMSQTSNNFTPRSNFLRRSFHKLNTSPSKILTIDLAEESRVVDTADTRASCDIVQNVTAPKTSMSDLGPLTTIDLDEEPAGEGMDLVEEEEPSGQRDTVTETVSSSSSNSVELLQAAEPGPTKSVSVEAKSSTSIELDSPELPNAEKADANDVVSSMGNSYGDVSSSGCMKNNSTLNCIGHRQGVQIGADVQHPLNEFDLLLLKINQTIPPMSQKDRIDQWRVTADDLLHSIPTKAAIETTSTGAKRPLHDVVHVSSDDDSDNLDTDTDGPCTRAHGHKKRRTIEGGEGQSEAPTHFVEVKFPPGGAGCLDFRKSQINPEIDKPLTDRKIVILQRMNYHKLPTRYREHDHSVGLEQRAAGCTQRWSGCIPKESFDGGLSPAGGEVAEKPYAHLLNRDKERDKFLSYLKISPFFRTDEKVFISDRASGERTSDDGLPGILNLSPKNGINKILAANFSPKINRLKSCRTMRTKQRNKESRKKPPRNKAHPSVIASSAVRGARRLVLSSSLRSGKVIRYRNNILNTLVKPKPRLANPPRTRKMDGVGGDATLDKEQSVKKCSTTSVRSASLSLTAGIMESNVSQKRRQRRSASAAMSFLQQVCSPVPSASSSVVKNSSKERCSVDSAVSSSTSAEMRNIAKQSKGCQTMSVVRPISPSPAVNDGKRLRNPVARSDGEILHVFLIDERLIVVQRERVSFWKFSRLSMLLGVKQDWQRVGQIQRWNRDTEVDSHSANRIVFNQTDPVYLEPRARNLNDDKSRACPLASIYVNAYFLDMQNNTPIVSAKIHGNVDASTKPESNDVREEGDDCNDELLRMKSYQLDTVKSALEDIRLVPLPSARDFIVCWHEHVSEMESRTGLCKYTLTPDLDSLGCIREFVVVKHRLTSLRCLNDRKLLGLGQSTVHIWCFESGYLLRTVDLKIEIGLTMGAFLHIEEDTSTLIMLQLQKPPEPASNNRKLVKVIAVNLYKLSWYMAHSYEIALASTSIAGESPMWKMDESNATSRHCVTFDSGEILLVSLADPTSCWTNHERLEKDLQRVETGSVNICSRLRSNSSNELYRWPRERILNGSNWNGGRDLVFLSEQLLVIKTIDEYMMEMPKDR